MDTAVTQCLEALEANNFAIVTPHSESYIAAQLIQFNTSWRDAPVFSVDDRLLQPRNHEPLSETATTWLHEDMLPFPASKFIVEFQIDTEKAEPEYQNIDRLLCLVDTENPTMILTAWRMKRIDTTPIWQVSNFTVIPSQFCKTFQKTSEILNKTPLPHPQIQAVHGTLSLLVLLTTPYVKRETRSASTKLNARRQHKGRPPIPTQHVVKLDLGRGSTTAAGKPRQSNDAHAPPRPHWRRGHVRRLPSGQHTRVSPTVVGVEPAYREQMKKAIPKPTYRVETS